MLLSDDMIRFLERGAMDSDYVCDFGVLLTDLIISDTDLVYELDFLKIYAD